MVREGLGDVRRTAARQLGPCQPWRCASAACPEHFQPYLSYRLHDKDYLPKRIADNVDLAACTGELQHCLHEETGGEPGC